MIEDHKAHNDPLNTAPRARDEPQDAAEIWGRRIGRTLGVAFAVFLIWRLLADYVFKS